MGKVYSLRTAPVTRDSGWKNTCFHSQGFHLHNKRRCVTCRICGAYVDPFDALAKLAERWEEWQGRRDRLQAEIERLESRAESHGQRQTS